MQFVLIIVPETALVRGHDLLLLSSGIHVCVKNKCDSLYLCLHVTSGIHELLVPYMYLYNVVPPISIL